MWLLSPGGNLGHSVMGRWGRGCWPHCSKLIGVSFVCPGSADLNVEPPELLSVESIATLLGSNPGPGTTGPVTLRKLAHLCGENNSPCLSQKICVRIK